MSNSVTQAKHCYKPFTYFIMIFASIGGILYGYDIGIINGALTSLTKELQLNINQTSTIVAAVLGGGSVATLISGPCADFFGRRPMIFSAIILFIIGTLILVFSHNYATLLSGRLIQGISIGIITIVIPLYLVESIPAELRGRSITLFQCFLTAGIVLASLIGLLLIDSGNWRWMFASALIPALILLVGTFWLSHSPRWLFFHGQVDKARQTLLRTYHEHTVEHELAEMRTVQLQENLTKLSIIDIMTSKQYVLPLFIAISIAILNQLTGINSFLQLSTLIIKKAGLNSEFVSQIGTVGITLINFIVTLIVLFFIDRIGRRPLMLFGTIGIFLSLMFMGFIAHSMAPSATQAYLILSGMIAFIFFFASGPGVIVWLAVSELLPMPVRSKGMAVALFLNSLSSAIFARLFLPLTENIGYSGVYWLAAGFVFLYFLVVYFLLPETKNKSLEEIEEGFL